jgi:hypothetical protein
MSLCICRGHPTLESKALCAHHTAGAVGLMGLWEIALRLR